MPDFRKKEKLLILAFIITTILTLWLISPMGQLYLPVKTDSLEKVLSFKLPQNYTLKRIRHSNNADIYDIENHTPTTHILSIVIFKDNASNKPQYIDPIDSTDDLRTFWNDTKLKDFTLNPCKIKIIDKHKFNICYFKALWPNLNHDSPMEGEYCSFKKGDKIIFTSSIASQHSYKPSILNKLISSINNNES